MDNTEKVKAYPFRPGISPTTNKLVELLKSGKIGDIITDEQLQKCCGYDCKPHGKAYGNLRTAQRIVLREYDLCWKREVGANCLKCLCGDEKMNVADSSLHHIRRVSKHTNVVLSTIKNGDINEENKGKYLTLKAISGTLELISQKKTIKKLEARKAGNVISMDKLLEGLCTIK